VTSDARRRRGAGAGLQWALLGSVSACKLAFWSVQMVEQRLSARGLDASLTSFLVAGLSHSAGMHLLRASRIYEIAPLRRRRSGAGMLTPTEGSRRRARRGQGGQEAGRPASSWPSTWTLRPPSGKE
jgi:hypothetical protein